MGNGDLDRMRLTLAGSGIGALTSLFTIYPSEKLFPYVDFPDTHNSPILKAGYIFSFLT